MTMKDLDIAGGTPPRTVDDLTRVTGHNISNSNARPAICECGERQPNDWPGTPRGWREEHLRTAWPLVARDSGESKESFLGRLSELYVAASAIEQGIDTSVGSDAPAHGRQPFPPVADRSKDIGELVAVLDHQMQTLREELLRTRWAD